jgi:hypothetical protein
MGGESVDGDFGGEVDPDFVDFLKNREGDLFGGRGCGREGGGPRGERQFVG